MKKYINLVDWEQIINATTVLAYVIGTMMMCIVLSGFFNGIEITESPAYMGFLIFYSPIIINAVMKLVLLQSENAGTLFKQFVIVSSIGIVWATFGIEIVDFMSSNNGFFVALVFAYMCYSISGINSNREIGSTEFKGKYAKVIRESIPSISNKKGVDFFHDSGIDKEFDHVIAHEAGHALLFAHPLAREYIVKGAFSYKEGAFSGYVEHEVNKHTLSSRELLYWRCCLNLAGMASEELLFKDRMIGSTSDLIKFEKLATHYLSHSNDSFLFQDSPDREQIAYNGEQIG